MSKLQKLTHRDFKHIFTEAPGGAQILEHLNTRFGQPSYVRGGQEADRETCYRAGQRSVLDYLNSMINKEDGYTDE